MVTLKHETDVDILDDIKVPVNGDLPDDEDLTEAVHGAIKSTIISLLDGIELHWKIDEDGNNVLSFVGGMPEKPVGLGQWVAPYRTLEDLRESEGGLLDQLPEGYHMEPRTTSELVFYKT